MGGPARSEHVMAVAGVASMLQEDVQDDTGTDRDQQEITVVTADPLIAALRPAQMLSLPVVHHIRPAAILGRHTATAPVPTLPMAALAYRMMALATGAIISALAVMPAPDPDDPGPGFDDADCGRDDPGDRSAPDLPDPRAGLRPQIVEHIRNAAQIGRGIQGFFMSNAPCCDGQWILQHHGAKMPLG